MQSNRFVIGYMPVVMLYRYFFIIIFILGILEPVVAKDYIDSLETKLILVDNHQKLLILDELIPHYFRNDPRLADKKAEKMLGIARQENNQEYIIRAQRYRGMLNSYITSEHEIALEECARIEFNAKSNGFTKELILIKLAIADIYSQIGESTKALEFEIDAYHLADSAGFNDLIPMILNSEAKSYIELNDLDRAEQSLKQSLKHAKIHDLQETVAKTHILFGDLFEKVFNHEYALVHYQAAHEIFLKQRRDLQIAIVLFKIGKCYFSMGEIQTSFQNHLQALAIRNRINDRTGLAESYNEIGALCVENGEYQRAINNLKLGLNNAEIINSNLLMQQSFGHLSEAYLRLKNSENALYYQKQYIEISDLIYTEASERKIRELENQNDIESRDLRLENLKKVNESTERELAASRRFNIVLALLLLVILVSTVLTVRAYREKRRYTSELERINNEMAQKNNELTELNSTKDKFFSIIGHDLKGPLNSLTSFSSLLINHTASLTEEEIRTVAKDLDKSLKNLYELLDNLLGWARSQTGRIEFIPENFKIAEVIRENVRLLAKAALNKKIKIEVLVDDELFVNADINSVKTIIRNLLSNAIKFTQEDGVITIFVDEWKDKVEIGIHDTGVGMSKEDQDKIFDVSAKHSTLGTNKEKGTGLGLILCKEFVERNGGNISVESQPDSGATFKFTLQKKQDFKLEEKAQA